MVAFKFILVVAFVLCVLLVAIILAQNPKGGGLSSSIGGGSGNQMFGVQQTNKFLVNTTWGFAIAIALIALFSSYLIDKPSQEIINPASIETSINLNEGAPSQPMTPIESSPEEGK